MVMREGIWRNILDQKSKFVFQISKCGGRIIENIQDWCLIFLRMLVFAFAKSMYGVKSGGRFENFSFFAFAIFLVVLLCVLGKFSGKFYNFRGRQSSSLKNLGGKKRPIH